MADHDSLSFKLLSYSDSLPLLGDGRGVLVNRMGERKRTVENYKKRWRKETEEITWR